ncbi:MAG: DUF5317 domain-containing protein [Chloroflexota bacterium]|nr:DUF5317 domain-containing protein [Chloroflexota bacterium]
MILVFAIAIGLLAGYLKARFDGISYQTTELRCLWLVLLAALPQYLIYSLPVTREKVSDQWIPFFLISTQLILLLFVWLNRKSPSFWLLGMGLLLNFVVISLNGGWMPISPATLESQNIPSSQWQLGSRFGYSKDLVMAKESINLWILSDILTLPKGIPYRVAFSIGDVLLSLGVIGFLIHNKQADRETRKVYLQENLKP